jgi:heme/copper-type cytochrome/quinol oxidase subunit 2
VKVTVRNYDEGEHSFTSMQLGLNVTFPAGSAKQPSTTTFTFHAPTKKGSYLWWCALPCDPWAMSHVGYMRGYVAVA